MAGWGQAAADVDQRAGNAEPLFWAAMLPPPMSADASSPPQFFFLKYVDPATYQILGEALFLSCCEALFQHSCGSEVHSSAIHCMVSTPGPLPHATRTAAPLPHVPQATSRL